MIPSFDKAILDPLVHSIGKHANRVAFCINQVDYSYQQLGDSIASIRNELSHHSTTNPIGLVANDDLATYASILALWLEGQAYVPLHPHQPLERCEEIIRQAGIELILDSSNQTRHTNHIIIATSKLTLSNSLLKPQPTIDDQQLAYVLFTSGSTGAPKGVPITRGNLAAFVESFWKLGYQLDENDRCLQMFDLTFDLSVMSYLIPLTVGASVYTIPHNTIKFNYLFELLDEKSLTFSMMVPSILNYLRPYFDEIDCPSLKYSLFCGEPFHENLCQEWSRCVPNARIDNIYGPTENTIICTCYTYNRRSENKTYNGILSIGQDMHHNLSIIVDPEDRIVEQGEKGELCLSGLQLTPGYINNPQLNEKLFFMKEHQGNLVRFYRSGDICFRDGSKNIFYVNRKDHQVKIQGFRVELSEIEFFAKKATQHAINLVALAINLSGHDEIAMVLESEPVDVTPAIDFMKSQIPAYMIPSQTYFIKPFPINTSGKTDRKAIAELIFKENQNG